MATGADSLRAILAAARGGGAVESAAVVGRDGIVVASELPGGSAREVFGAMMAAALAAAETGMAELGRGTPRQLLIESSTARALILGVDASHLLVVLGPAPGDARTLAEAASRLLSAVQASLRRS